jgi:hypothetical protein
MRGYFDVLNRFLKILVILASTHQRSFVDGVQKKKYRATEQEE